MQTNQEITITRPDDWHLHLRDGDALKAVLPDTARRFRRAIVMPNLKPPVTTVELALAYRERIMAALPAGYDFTPLMTLYLTDNTSPAEVEKAAANEHVHAFKLYPAGATTNSDSGVSSMEKISGALEAMQKHNVPLLVHAEVTDGDIDVFDRENVFIDRHLTNIVRDFPELRVVFEHITTKAAAQFVRDARDGVGATITPQHLLLNRNAIFQGGIRPHHYCLPILKREGDREALVAAATSGSPRFFIGTDSAPHARHLKENACGCAGVYSAHAGIELYARVFELADALDKFEAFMSFNGPDFYGLPRNKDKVTLTRKPWTVPSVLSLGEHELTPFRAGERMEWSLVD